MATLRLKKGEERRLHAGHLWVFSNEVDTRATPLKQFEPGQTVSVESSRGDTLGHGYVNPHSLISARICAYQADALTPDWFRQRLQQALDLREAIYTAPCYRLVHGEGDFLPGLVIDRFGEVLIVQVTTAGMEKQLETLVDVLLDLLSPNTIYLRNDNAVRELEQLDRYESLAHGNLPAHLSIEENGIHYQVPVTGGQKTGWFFDHRDNRALLAPYVKGKRVLDGYSYAGAWGINALHAGANAVVAVDASRTALDIAENNAELNNHSSKYTTVCGDCVESMRGMIAEGEKFDVVVLDPPAFIKRKKDYRNGLNYYAQNNKLAVQLLAPGGILLSASCSQPLKSEDLSNSMLRAARKQGHGLQLLHTMHQAPDHPVNAAMPETRYLKGFVGRLL